MSGLFDLKLVFFGSRFFNSAVMRLIASAKVVVESCGGSETSSCGSSS